MKLNDGRRLVELSHKSPVLLVFLRHFGCTFCREAMQELSERREEIEQNGTELVLVHMSDRATADRYFNRYSLPGVLHISDPECRFYADFGLTKGSMTQLFGLQSWIRGFQAGVIKGHGVGAQLGDGFQMPGVFVLKEGVVIDKFIHRLSSDRPDYISLMNCCRT